jgi:hypothetical protein
MWSWPRSGSNRDDVTAVSKRKALLASHSKKVKVGMKKAPGGTILYSEDNGDEDVNKRER